MLPVAVLPAAAILMGVLFAVGVALGMSKDKDGAAALSVLVAWQIVMVLVTSDSIFMLQSITIVDDAKIKSAGVVEINKVSNKNIQVIVGTEVQFVADEMSKSVK